MDNDMTGIVTKNSEVKKTISFSMGDIYKEACYYQCQFSNELIEIFHLDTSKLYFKNSFTSETISNNLPGFSPEDRKVYQHIEKTVKK